MGKQSLRELSHFWKAVELGSSRAGVWEWVGLSELRLVPITHQGLLNKARWALLSLPLVEAVVHHETFCVWYVCFLLLCHKIP